MNTAMLMLLTKTLILMEIYKHSQYVTNNSNTPHICSKTDLIIIDNFWSNKFWCSNHDLGTFTFFKKASKTKVYDFYSVGILISAQNVFRFEVKMKDAILVHVGHALTDLSHEVDTVSLCQYKVITNDSLEQFPSPYTVNIDQVIS